MKHLPNLGAGLLAMLGLLVCQCDFSGSTSVDLSAADPSASMDARITNGPAGIMSAQYGDSPSGEGVANLMDGSTSTKFLTYHNAAWVKWQGNLSMKALSYAVTSANDAPERDPKNWTLLGSNDGTNWTTLDTRANQVFANRYQRNSYTIATPASYLFYKLDVTAVAGAASNTLQFSEWDLVGAASTPTTQTLEAEAATFVGPVKATKHPGYTGAGYLDFTHSTGDYVQWSFPVATAGTGSLAFRYANGSSATIKVKVTVNGVALATSLSMPYSGANWDVWATATASAQLKAGTNTVRITTIGVGQPNVDNLKVTSGSSTPTSCTPTAITPYIQVNGGALQQTAAITAATGATVKLSPAPTTGGTWSWSGPNGFAATSREATFSNIQMTQGGDYVAIYTNGSGCKSAQTFSVTTTSPDWAYFVYPTVTFTDNATALEGSTIFHNAIPDVAGMMKTQILAIVKEIYADNMDPRIDFTKLNMILEDDPTGVAAKSGNPPEITITISAQYIANFYHNNGDNLSLVEKEVRGVLSHEGTHAYQWAPKNCGTYDGSSVFWAFLEGEADGVRAELTNWTPTRYPYKGGTVNSGYNRTGFFLSWCKRNKKPTFLIELNHAAREMATFTWDAAFQQILGIGVQQAWDEYQATLPN